MLSLRSKVEGRSWRYPFRRIGSYCSREIRKTAHLKNILPNRMCKNLLLVFLNLPNSRDVLACKENVPDILGQYQISTPETSSCTPCWSSSYVQHLCQTTLLCRLFLFLNLFWRSHLSFLLNEKPSQYDTTATRKGVVLASWKSPAQPKISRGFQASDLSRPSPPVSCLKPWGTFSILATI